MSEDECIPTHYGGQEDKVGAPNTIPCLMQEDSLPEDKAYLLQESGGWIELEL